MMPPLNPSIFARTILLRELYSLILQIRCTPEQEMEGQIKRVVLPPNPEQVPQKNTPSNLDPLPEDTNDDEHTSRDSGAGSTLAIREAFAKAMAGHNNSWVGAGRRTSGKPTNKRGSLWKGKSPEPTNVVQGEWIAKTGREDLENCLMTKFHTFFLKRPLRPLQIARYQKWHN